MNWHKLTLVYFKKKTIELQTKFVRLLKWGK